MKIDLFGDSFCVRKCHQDTSKIVDSVMNISIIKSIIDVIKEYQECVHAGKEYIEPNFKLANLEIMK